MSAAIESPQSPPCRVRRPNCQHSKAVHAFGGIRDVTPWLDSRNEWNLQQDWHAALFPVRTAVILVAVGLRPLRLKHQCE
jgi:hypothetical protein